MHKAPAETTTGVLPQANTYGTTISDNYRDGEVRVLHLLFATKAPADQKKTRMLTSNQRQTQN
jgi:hypothetical protein